MKTAKSRRSARPGFVRAHWRERVDPAFVAYFSAMKKNRDLPKIKDEKQSEKKFREWFREIAVTSRALDEARRRIENLLAAKIQSAILKPLDIEGDEHTGARLPSKVVEEPNNGIYPQNPESSGIFRTLVFLKYGITFRELIRQIDLDKNPNAHKQLMKVHRDYWRLLSGVQFKDFRLKFGFDHFQIIIQGFDFGLENLAPADLTECLDEICPCGQKHSLEYLKKLRTRIKQACDRLV
jgi:hypothetical protein